MNHNITYKPYYHNYDMYPIPIEKPLFTESPYPITTTPNLVSVLEPFNINNYISSITPFTSTTPVLNQPIQMNTLYDSLLHKQIIDNTKNIENFFNTIMASDVPIK